VSPSGLEELPLVTLNFAKTEAHSQNTCTRQSVTTIQYGQKAMHVVTEPKILFKNADSKQVNPFTLKTTSMVAVH
jgi:hypothetical protein